MNQGIFGFPTQPAPSQSKVFTYLTSGTFTIPENYSRIEILAQGGGTGGMSGNLNSTGDLGGGAGGRAGNLGYSTFYPQQLQTNTLYISIGAGGAGGAARTTNGVANTGSSGGDTIVSTGMFNIAVGGYANAATSATSLPPTNFRLYMTGVNGGQGASRNSTSPYGANDNAGGGFQFNGLIAPAGGGAGGSGTAPSGTNTRGGNTPNSIDTTRNTSFGNMGTIGFSSGGQADGENGENGKPRFGLFGATGGGGGAGNTTGTGNGGNGGHGIYGSGGGGGGGALAGTGVSSGAGGNGGSGFVVIIVYY